MPQNFFEKIENEQIALRQVFNKYLRGVDSPKRILNFCCGIANEETLLYEKYGDNIDLISLDIRTDMEELARELGRKSFKLGDIRKIEKYVSGEFDFMIGRNIPLYPQLGLLDSRDSEDWIDSFRKLTSFLSRDGTLFLTTMRDDEFIRASEILEELKYEILFRGRNKIYVPTDSIGVAGGDSKDHYIHLAKKSLD